MALRLIKYLVLPFFILLFILGATAGDLHFSISRLQLLTADMMERPHELSYTQYFEVDHAMKFRLDIANQDKSLTAALIWPQEPFSKILILVANPDENTNKRTDFQGQLVRCVYRCLPSGMYIEMNDFVGLLEEKFPAYKNRPRLMPTMLLDTTAKPLGLIGYVRHHLILYSLWAASIVISLGVMGYREGLKSKV